jgi:hypothetical protein
MAFARPKKREPEGEAGLFEYAVGTAHLAKQVNLNRPGRYTVQVSHRDAEHNVAVKSNDAERRSFEACVLPDGPPARRAVTS